MLAPIVSVIEPCGTACEAATVTEAAAGVTVALVVREGVACGAKKLGYRIGDTARLPKGIANRHSLGGGDRHQGGRRGADRGRPGIRLGKKKKALALPISTGGLTASPTCWVAGAATATMATVATRRAAAVTAR